MNDLLLAGLLDSRSAYDSLVFFLQRGFCNPKRKEALTHFPWVPSGKPWQQLPSASWHPQAASSWGRCHLHRAPGMIRSWGPWTSPISNEVVRKSHRNPSSVPWYLSWQSSEASAFLPDVRTFWNVRVKDHKDNGWILEKRLEQTSTRSVSNREGATLSHYLPAKTVTRGHLWDRLYLRYENGESNACFTKQKSLALYKILYATLFPCRDWERWTERVRPIN